MRYLLLVFFLASFLCVCSGAKAESIASDGLTQFGAHFGMSYAIGTFTYQLMYKGFGADKPHSLLFSGVITGFTGFFYKYLEAFDNNGRWPSDTYKSMGYNVVGWSASVVVLQF